MVLMQMLMNQQEVMGRSLNTFTDESVKVGKKTCTSDFTFTVKNLHTFRLSNKKGKVTVIDLGGSTGVCIQIQLTLTQCHLLEGISRRCI